jgi:hypothetical protein
MKQLRSLCKPRKFDLDTDVLARGFGVKDFKDMLASTRANQVRFKTPSEFSNRWLRGADTFGNTGEARLNMQNTFLN